MKAILVIDMPNDCVYCPCWRVGSDEFPHSDCTAMQRPLTDEEEMNRPSWCPLRPLPQKTYAEFPDSYKYGFADGWNGCLKEIQK